MKPGPSTPVPRVRARPVPGTGTAGGLGSDQRQKEPVHGHCILCLRSTELQLSHIRPKWAARAAKKEGGVYHTPSNQRRSSRMQDDYKHYLLCRDCEQYLGEGENALERVSSASFAVLESNGLGVRPVQRDAWRITGPKRYLLQRGILGIALKYHFAPSARTRLFGTTIAPLRSALLTDNYGGFAPPFVSKYYAFESLAGYNPQAISGVGITTKAIGDPQAVTVDVGGLEWFAPVARGTWGLSAALKTDASWLLLLRDAASGIHLGHRAIPPGDLQTLWQELEKSRPCPCGASSTAEACCALTWAQHLN